MPGGEDLDGRGQCFQVAYLVTIDAPSGGNRNGDRICSRHFPQVENQCKVIGNVMALKRVLAIRVYQPRSF